MRSCVLYERVGSVAAVTMNRPQYRNAQSRVLLEELDGAPAEAMADHEVLVVVLFGAGEHWSSGHDIGTPEELADRDARPYPAGAVGVQQRSWDWNVENTLRWRDLPKPTLAAAQGMCIYGGWMIAAAMDLIVAADNARFIPFLFQYQSTPWDIGARRAKDLMWEQGLLDAHQAQELGFVSQVVPWACASANVQDGSGAPKPDGSTVQEVSSVSPSGSVAVPARLTGSPARPDASAPASTIGARLAWVTVKVMVFDTGGLTPSSAVRVSWCAPGAVQTGR